MNGETRTFRTVSGLALLAGAGLLLCACASLPNLDQSFATPAIDQKSPAAAAVADILKAPGDYPTFASIPEPPTDLKSAEQYKADVTGQQQTADALIAATAPSTWTLSETDAFAAQAMAEAKVETVTAPTDAEVASSEAYARALRAKASPPPRPH
jgi:hypothetical protein